VTVITNPCYVPEPASLIIIPTCPRARVRSTFHRQPPRLCDETFSLYFILVGQTLNINYWSFVFSKSRFVLTSSLNYYDNSRGKRPSFLPVDPRHCNNRWQFNNIGTRATIRFTFDIIVSRDHT